MAKFIKFEIKNAATLTSGTGSRDILLNVDDIENIADGAGAASVIITLKSGLATFNAGHAAAADIPSDSVAGRILTLSTGLNLNSDPANTTGAGVVAIAPVAVPSVVGNMPSQSVNRALTANPGGVSSKVQLALDGAGSRAGGDSQMYFVQAAFSTDVTL